jgi:hypothetical protein
VPKPLPLLAAPEPTPAEPTSAEPAKWELASHAASSTTPGVEMSFSSELIMGSRSHPQDFRQQPPSQLSSEIEKRSRSCSRHVHLLTPLVSDV